ncbi:MAG: hypothetical protein R3C24_13585 [Cyanobacteriota/Melainabacteria group bacterium]
MNRCEPGTYGRFGIEVEEGGWNIILVDAVAPERMMQPGKT